MFGNSRYLQRLAMAEVARLRKPAEEGDDVAQFSLGWNYVSHLGDYPQALMWFGKAADQQNARAQCYLGWMYANGLGARRDYVQAHMWYILASSDAETRDFAVKCRDALAARMTTSQVAEAQRMAREWTPK